MRLLVTGGSGLLGSDLVPAARSRGHDVLAPSASDFDVTDPEAVARLSLGELGRFDWCLNLAAYTNVDAAESHAREAIELNLLAPAYLATACLAAMCRLVHISTDYVFGGSGKSDYGEEDPVAPVQKYGLSKAEGEEAVSIANPDAIIARVSWLFGPARRCFPVGLIESFRAGTPLRIVNDQWGVPSYTGEVSRMLLDLIEANPPGDVYHVCGSQAVSRFQYAEAVAAAFSRATGKRASEMAGVPSSEFPTPATRPANSVILAGKVLRYTHAHMPLDEAMDRLLARLGD